MVGDARIVPRSLRCSISVGWVPRSLLRRTYSQTSKSPIGVGDGESRSRPLSTARQILMQIWYAAACCEV